MDMNQAPVPNQPDEGNPKLLIIAIALAVVAVVLTNIYIERVRRQVEENSFDVYVLTRAVRPGDRMTERDVRKLAVPQKFKDSFEGLGAMDEAGLKTRLAERETLQRAASAGSVLTYAMFLAEGGDDLDRNIAPGKRLVSLPVNSRTAPGALREGMFVDIEATFATGASLPVTLPVMENVKVVALGTRTVYDDDTGARQRPIARYQSITIEVSPDEATHLSMVQRLMIGDFDLHLRNPRDAARPKIPEGGINPAVLDLIERRHQRPGETGRR